MGEGEVEGEVEGQEGGDRQASAISEQPSPGQLVSTFSGQWRRLLLPLLLLQQSGAVKSEE